jgi:hypothetical protein
VLNLTLFNSENRNEEHLLLATNFGKVLPLIKNNLLLLLKPPCINHSNPYTNKAPVERFY